MKLDLVRMLMLVACGMFLFAGCDTGETEIEDDIEDATEEAEDNLEDAGEELEGSLQVEKDMLYAKAFAVEIA